MDHGSGTLPRPDARRRNAPTIPTTRLPAGGYTGEIPEPAYDLRDAGQRWWDWAWTLPQAAAWDDGSMVALARRAQLEDDLAALELVDDVDLLELLQVDLDDRRATREAVRNLEWALGRLKASAGGRLALLKEMRELDRRFGLDPKAMAELRWTIVARTDDRAAAPMPPSSVVDRPGSNVRRLRPRDPRLAAS